jgi:hypothetical protein
MRSTLSGKDATMETNGHAAGACTTPMTTIFTTAQWQALERLRERYRQGCDCLSAPVLVNLRFTRWLYQTGRLEP